MSKFTTSVVQNPGSHLFQKTAFSPRTAKFLFIALLTFAIALTSISVQAAPQTAIAYSSSANNPSQMGLFSIQPTGRDRRQIVPALAGGIGAPVWSPNGQRIAFTVGEQDVYVVNGNGSNLKKRFAGDGGCKAPSIALHWLSDNQRVVFSRSCDGFTSDAPGTVSVFLTNNQRTTSRLWSLSTDQGIRSNVAFSPQGQVISYVQNRSLYRITLDSPGVTQPITPADSETGYQFSSVVWSPDSTKIARIDYLEGEKQRISIVQADGKQLAQWTNPGINWSANNLIWSPNSQQVAYYRLEPNSLQSIELFDLKTKTQKSLTSKPGEYNNLTWSPDRRQLAFTLKVDSSRTALYTIELQTSASKDLTPKLKTESLEGIAWSPDSRQLTFTAGTISANNLYMINRDGKGLRQLTRDRNISIFYPAWQP
ncbi:hypothetical protein ACQ4M3_06475 [Leptolyngbya sp. AN03gr2]|uniref:hypothetical protein n=1 Tax=unclassified Leptolyngbya TaxID=2650499 RepID=UPI003D31664A